MSATDNEQGGETILFEGRPALVPSLAVLAIAIITLGLWLLPRLWQRASKSYRVTTRRIVVETAH